MPDTGSLSRRGWWLCWLFAMLVAGCSLSNFTTGLSGAILNQTDPETVRDGAPAFLLMVDGLIESSPDDEEYLAAGAQLYATYATVFVDDPERAKRLATRGWNYGRRGLCAADSSGCGIAELPYEEFEKKLGELDGEDKPLFAFAVGWLTRIKAFSEEITALADLPKVQLVLERIVAEDPTFGEGKPYHYLGILESLRPPALGGKPDKAKGYFERAMALSQRRDLSVMVSYAEGYARLVYDRNLHDELLGLVVGADPVKPGLTLTNILAQRAAEKLLAEADEYF